MIKIFHHFNPSQHGSRLKIASPRDRIIAQLIDSIFLSVICSIIIFLFSRGKIYSTWVAPIIPQFLLEVEKGLQTDIADLWWGGHFFSIHLPYGKDIFSHYPAPLLWFVYGAYYVLFTVFAGQTPGKMMKRLVVLSTTHEAKPSQNTLSMGAAIIRWAAYYLSFIPLGMGFWWGGFSSDKKTWHDKISRTQVYQF